MSWIQRHNHAGYVCVVDTGAQPCWIRFCGCRAPQQSLTKTNARYSVFCSEFGAGIHRPAKWLRRNCSAIVQYPEVAAPRCARVKDPNSDPPNPPSNTSTTRRTSSAPPLLPPRVVHGVGRGGVVVISFAGDDVAPSCKPVSAQDVRSTPLPVALTTTPRHNEM